MREQAVKHLAAQLRFRCPDENMAMEQSIIKYIERTARIAALTASIKEAEKGSSVWAASIKEDLRGQRGYGR